MASEPAESGAGPEAAVGQPILRLTTVTVIESSFANEAFLSMLPIGVVVEVWSILQWILQQSLKRLAPAT